MVEPAGLGERGRVTRLVLGRLLLLAPLLAGVTLVMFLLAQAAPFGTGRGMLGWSHGGIIRAGHRHCPPI